MNPRYTKSKLNKLSHKAIHDLWLKYNASYNVAFSYYSKSEYIDGLLLITKNKYNSHNTNNQPF